MFATQLQVVSVSLVSLLLSVPAVNAQAFALNTASYPTVGDHHCIAWYCDAVHWDSDGYHRDDQNTYNRRRRHAIGCDGVTNCGSTDSCDEIPYASTYDGGLGCFAQRWTAAGGNVNSLQSRGTHMCVVRGDNSAHGSALSTFYAQQNVGNFGRFTVVLPVNNAGCTASGWCNRLRRANHGISGETLAQACTAARANGKQYALITASQYNTYPRCPSRGYRRDESSTEIDDDNLELIDPRDEDTSSNTTEARIPRIFRTELGNYYLEMMNGTVQEGDEVWHHDDSLVNGTTSKVAEFTTYEKAFGPTQVQRRQTCQ